MSKIAEKKVMELGYGIDPLKRNEYSADDVFDAAVECYDQAFQDFMEKACEWLEKELLVSDIEHRKYWLMTEENKSNFIKDFKKYMQNESN